GLGRRGNRPSRWLPERRTWCKLRRPSAGTSARRRNRGRQRSTVPDSSSCELRPGSQWRRRARRSRRSSSRKRRWDSLAILLIPCGFHPVCGPHAQGTEHDPADEPGEIEWDAKDHGIKAVPERNREAHSNERNQTEEDSNRRWLLCGHRFTEYSRPATAGSAQRVLDYFAVLHHELHMCKLADVLRWISAYGDQAGEGAGCREGRPIRYG